MNQYCLACDLKEDESLIHSYEEYHKNVWPEIKDSLRQSGIEAMEIYRTGNRLFMIIQCDNDFNFERKATMDNANPIVLKWEALMDTYQQRIPWAGPDVKWVLMEKIFSYKV